jgi:hypothetical protein
MSFIIAAKGCQCTHKSATHPHWYNTGSPLHPSDASISCPLPTVYRDFSLDGAVAGKADGGGAGYARTGLRSVRSRLGSSVGEVEVDCVEMTDRPDVRREGSTGCDSTSPSPKPATAVAALLLRRGGLVGNGTPVSVVAILLFLDSGREGRSGRSGRSAGAAGDWSVRTVPLFPVPARPPLPKLGLSSSTSSGTNCAGSLDTMTSTLGPDPPPEAPFAAGCSATSCPLSPPSAAGLSAGLILNRFVGLTPSFPSPSSPGAWSMRGRPNE